MRKGKRKGSGFGTRWKRPNFRGRKFQQGTVPLGREHPPARCCEPLIRETRQTAFTERKKRESFQAESPLPTDVEVTVCVFFFVIRPNRNIISGSYPVGWALFGTQSPVSLGPSIVFFLKFLTRLGVALNFRGVHALRQNQIRSRAAGNVKCESRPRNELETAFPFQVLPRICSCIFRRFLAQASLTLPILFQANRIHCSFPFC